MCAIIYYNADVTAELDEKGIGTATLRHSWLDSDV